MTRITIFADIAGRPTKSVANPLTTAAAVVIRTDDLASIRARLPSSLPKWKHFTKPIGRRAVGFLGSHAMAVAAVTVNRDTHQWSKAIDDSEYLHSKIASQSRAKAGWAKLPVVLTYELISRACFLALAHTLRTHHAKHVFSSMGATAVECNVVCDQEFSADEDVDVFKSFWNDNYVHTDALWRLGYSVRHPSVSVTTDNDERLLILADIAAGLCHSARLTDPGRLAMPLSCSVSRRLLEPLVQTGKLTLDAYAFGTTYDEVFGEAMQIVRDRGA